MAAIACQPAISSEVLGGREPAAGRYLEIDPETFRTHFNREPFIFRHHASSHPLFEQPRLVKLAQTLAANFVEFNSGVIPVSLPDWENTPYTGLDAVETIRRVDERCSWMVLKRAEHDPDYRQLLDHLLDEIEPLSERIDPGMCEREAAVFVSSPGSTTPYHIDHEINFLLQIRGTKTISVFSADNRDVLSERELEEYFASPQIHRNLPFAEAFQEHAYVFELRQGEGVHIPSTAPHWVKNGDATSVSFSASFKTPTSLRRGRIYCMNATLRKWGMKPSAYNESIWRDSVKHNALRALRRARRWLDNGAPAK